MLISSIHVLQSADNLKHRERWAKIKESHRRKKEAKAVAVRQPIVEEPEAEEAEDKAQVS